jgi:hypothetical protein
VAFEIRKAERRKAKLRLGLAGASGSGKTASSLLVAFGITGGWSKIGFIDTENGSGELYVGKSIAGCKIGEYAYGRIESPFTVPKYLEAVKALEAAGCEVIIIDSLSHAWAGEGGLLDKQGKLSDRGGNSYTAWRTVTPEHNSLVEAMLQSKCHIIAAVRSKTEYVQEKDSNGKTTVRKVGLAPIFRDGVEYEFTAFFDLAADHTAQASKDRTNLFDGLIFKPSVETGKALLEWLETGTDAPEPPLQENPPPTTTQQSPQRPPAPTPPPAEKTINDAQVKRLYTVANANGWTHEQVKATLAASKGKYASSRDIPVAKYDAVVGFFESNKPPAPAADEPPATTEGGSADA